MMADLAAAPEAEEQLQLLELEFTSGSIVQYSGVSPEVHRQFVNAPSPGSFFRDKIEEDFPAKRLR